ncbi:putative methyltransferase domain-containing protein [Eutypa lata UCREL1]|uniref:Putative methyltransferase domain-containing protein n=1 Tax=Eutypa lata (strain UCR-EL1) TaxID=1287681 RepID=M7T4R2_EUTLA|nr:putative methyltransferase domain-containing protein [Eutypa lata UCREL1]
MHIHHGLFRSPGESKEEAQLNLINYLLEISRLPRGARVLDVGCGIGGTSRFLAREHGCEVTGITISGRQVEIAKKLTLEDTAKPLIVEGEGSESDLLSYGNGGAKGGIVRFLELDAEKMLEHFFSTEGNKDKEQEGSSSFNCVWISEALSHLPNKPLFFSSSFSVLASGSSSRLVIADWFRAPDLTPEQVAADIKSIEDGMLLPKLYTAEEYVQMAEDAGFKTLQAPIDISAEVAKTWEGWSSIPTSVSGDEERTLQIEDSTITSTRIDTFVHDGSPVKPTIVLLQGTFQLPEVYHKFAKIIESRGFPVVQPSYPSLTGQDEPDFTKKTLADDVRVVETAIGNLVDGEGKTVLVVMHSYGGLVGAEVVPEDLTLKSRRDRGLPGGVASLFYFAAFVMPMGQSVATAVGDSPNHDYWDGRFKMRDPLSTMYNDLPADEAAYWSDRVIPQSSAVKGTVMARCAYAYVPSTYVVCTGDNAVPPQVQEMFAQLAGAQVKKIDSGHSPMLSKPEELMALLGEAAAAP